MIPLYTRSILYNHHGRQKAFIRMQPRLHAPRKPRFSDAGIDNHRILIARKCRRHRVSTSLNSGRNPKNQSPFPIRWMTPRAGARQRRKIAAAAPGERQRSMYRVLRPKFHLHVGEHGELSVLRGKTRSIGCWALVEVDLKQWLLRGNKCLWFGVQKTFCFSFIAVNAKSPVLAFLLYIQTPFSLQFQLQHDSGQEDPYQGICGGGSWSTVCAERRGAG